MKLRTKSIITLVTMLLGGIGQVAAQDEKPRWPPQTTTIIQLNGSSSSADAAGTLTVSISDPDENGKATATLTAKPATGNYITKDQIAVIRTIDGAYAQTREAGIDNTPLELTETTPNADPSGKTEYTFQIAPTSIAHTRAEWQDFFYVYDYEITANFQSKIDIKDATVQVAGTYEATGEAITVEADKVKVTVGGKELAANEFEISGYENNTKPGDATIKIAGLRPTFR